MPFKLTRAVKALLILDIAIFVIQNTVDQFFGGGVLSFFALTPDAFVIQHRVWQILTYAFLHDDIMHLFFNMLMFVFIGAELEALWGTKRFVKYFLFSAVSAGAFYILLVYVAWTRDAQFIPMLGASGGIYALLVAYGILFGERTMLFMMLFPMKAKHFVWILAGIEFMTTVFGKANALSGVAHLGGMLAGFVYLWSAAQIQLKAKDGWLKKKAAVSKKARKSSHLRLIIDNNPKRAVNEFERSSQKPGDDNDSDPKTWN